MNKSIIILFFVVFLRFPQISSGEGLNLFGNKEDDVILQCGEELGVNTFVVNLNNKTIKLFHTNKGVHTTYEVTEVSEIYVNGRNTTTKETITVWRVGVELEGGILGKVELYEEINNKRKHKGYSTCIFIERKF